MVIEINNLTATRIDKKFLEKITRLVLKEEKKGEKVYLSIALLKPARMGKLNRGYRKKNKATDVLSFPSIAFGYGGQARFLEKDSGLGEIILCPAIVKKNAKKYSSSFKKELARVLIHGILHLLGYEHEKPSARAELNAGPVPHRNKVSGAGSKRGAKKMEEKQQYYFSKI